MCKHKVLTFKKDSEELIFYTTYVGNVEVCKKCNRYVAYKYLKYKDDRYNKKAEQFLMRYKAENNSRLHS